MSYLRSSRINLAAGPSEHIVLSAALAVCPESSCLLQGCEVSFDYISLLNIKVEGV